MTRTFIRAETFNVQSQKIFNSAQRRKALEKLFECNKSDIIGFQEIDQYLHKRLKRIRKNLQFVHGKKSGDILINSIAFNYNRFDEIDRGHFWLSENGKVDGNWWDGSQRGTTWVTLRDSFTKKEVLIINTHLDNKGVIARKKAMEIILKFIAEQDTYLPIIFTADTNISICSPHKDIWGTKEMREPYEMILNADFTDCWTEVLEIPAYWNGKLNRPHTFHNGLGANYRGDEYGTWDTDWILCRGFKKVLNCYLKTDSHKGIFPSDHYPMVAELEFIDECS